LDWEEPHGIQNPEAEEAIGMNPDESCDPSIDLYSFQTNAEFSDLDKEVL
jgi:hypothetical protein